MAVISLVLCTFSCWDSLVIEDLRWVVWVNVASWATTKKRGKLGTGNREWARHSLRWATHSKARQGWNRVALAKMYVAIEGMGRYFTRYFPISHAKILMGNYKDW